MTQFEAESADFAAAIHLASQPGYLGNPAVVDGILVDLWNKTFSRWNSGVENVDSGIEVDTAECERVALIFLGTNSKFVAMPGWNRAGIIDQYIATVLQIDEANPTIRLAYALLSYLGEMWTAFAESKAENKTVEIFHQRAEALTQKYRYLLMGVLEPMRSSIQCHEKTPQLPNQAG